MAKVKQTSIALGEVEKKIAEEFAVEHGISFSSAVRSIVRRWAGLEDDRFRLTPKGKKALSQAVLEDAQKE